MDSGLPASVTPWGLVLTRQRSKSACVSATLDGLASASAATVLALWEGGCRDLPLGLGARMQGPPPGALGLLVAGGAGRA